LGFKIGITDKKIHRGKPELPNCQQCSKSSCHIAGNAAMWQYSRMKTVAIESQKGGTGKTTTALNLAVAAEKAGQAAVVIDLDPQASAAGWKDTRQAETPVVVSVRPAWLPQTLQAAKEGGAALALIDTAPHAESASLAAAKAADLILIPCRPGILDLRAIGTTAEIVKLAGKPAFVVLNAIPPGATRLLADARAGAAVHGLAVAPVASSSAPLLATR
jgi:chromosome partitioning protein